MTTSISCPRYHPQAGGPLVSRHVSKHLCFSFHPSYGKSKPKEKSYGRNTHLHSQALPLASISLCRYWQPDLGQGMCANVRTCAVGYWGSKHHLTAFCRRHKVFVLHCFLQSLPIMPLTHFLQTEYLKFPLFLKTTLLENVTPDLCVRALAMS